MKNYTLIILTTVSLLMLSCEKQDTKSTTTAYQSDSHYNEQKNTYKLPKKDTVVVDSDMNIKTNTMYECGHNNKAIGISWMSLNYTYTKKSKYILRENEDTIADSNVCELNTFNEEGKEVHFKKQQHETDSYHCRSFFVKEFVRALCKEIKKDDKDVNSDQAASSIKTALSKKYVCKDGKDHFASTNGSVCEIKTKSNAVVLRKGRNNKTVHQKSERMITTKFQNIEACTLWLDNNKCKM